MFTVFVVFPFKAKLKGANLNVSEFIQASKPKAPLKNKKYNDHGIFRKIKTQKSLGARENKAREYADPPNRQPKGPRN